MPAHHDTTLTMYFCGSGNNMTLEKTTKHAVPKLINIARNRHIGYDGPGGNPCSNPIYKMTDLGTFDQSTGSKEFTGKKTVKWYTWGKSKKNGATGYGTTKTLEAAIRWLGVMLSEHQTRPVNNINLCGHSRGSVTAVAVAWAIQDLIVPKLPRFNVNMFLFDPVEGGKHNYKEMYQFQNSLVGVNRNVLPPCVSSFRGLMSANMGGPLLAGMGKKDNGFQSTMPAAGACSDYKVYVMPGGHNAATKYNVLNEGSQIGRIGMHMAQSFLESHGSQFQGNFKLTGREVLECYAVARNPSKGARIRKAKFDSQDEDLKFFTDDNQALRSPHRSTTIPGDSVFGHKFWVNNHHREIFSAMFPSLAPKLDRGTITLDEMHRIAITCPETALLTRITGMVRHEGVRSYT